MFNQKKRICNQKIYEETKELEDERDRHQKEAMDKVRDTVEGHEGPLSLQDTERLFPDPEQLWAQLQRVPVIDVDSLAERMQFDLWLSIPGVSADEFATGARSFTRNTIIRKLMHWANDPSAPCACACVPAGPLLAADRRRRAP